MSDMGKRFLWVSIYAVAMALLEAVVVAYLRALLQITDQHVISKEMMEPAIDLANLIRSYAVRKSKAKILPQTAKRAEFAEFLPAPAVGQV